MYVITELFINVDGNDHDLNTYLGPYIKNIYC